MMVIEESAAEAVHREKMTNKNLERVIGNVKTGAIVVVETLFLAALLYLSGKPACAKDNKKLAPSTKKPVPALTQLWLNPEWEQSLDSKICSPTPDAKPGKYFIKTGPDPEGFYDRKIEIIDSAGRYVAEVLLDEGDPAAVFLLQRRDYKGNPSRIGSFRKEWFTVTGSQFLQTLNYQDIEDPEPFKRPFNVSQVYADTAGRVFDVEYLGYNVPSEKEWRRIRWEQLSDPKALVPILNGLPKTECDKLKQRLYFVESGGFFQVTGSNLKGRNRIGSTGYLVLSGYCAGYCKSSEYILVSPLCVQWTDGQISTSREVSNLLEGWPYK